MEGFGGDAVGQTDDACLAELARTDGEWRRLEATLTDVGWRTPSAERETASGPITLKSRVLFVVSPEGSAGRFAVNGQRAPRSCVTAVVCEPGDEVDCAPAEDGAGRVWQFHFALSWARKDGGDAAASGGHSRQRSFLPAPYPRVLSICRAIEQGWQQDELERFRCQSLFIELLYLLIVHQRAASREDPRSAIAATKRYIDAHYTEKLTIEQLTQLSGTSRGYFMQLFKEMYRVSPIDYIADRRIAAAREILRRSPALPLGEVARAAGYDDEGYFSRRFRQKLGVSPVAYKKSAGLKAIALNYHTIGHLLALQIIPSGAILDRRYVREYYERYSADVALHLHALSDENAVLQALARHQPDLIVLRDNTKPEHVSYMKQFASVLILPWNDDVRWRELFTMSASFLQMEKQAERWLDQYERKVEAVKKQLPPAVGRESLLIVSVTEKGLFLVGSRLGGSVLYGDIGLTPACPIGDALLPTTPDAIGAIPADRILVIADSGAAAQRQLAELTDSAAWRQSPAVRRRNIHRVQRGLWFEYTPHAHLWSLNAAARLFS